MGGVIRVKPMQPAVLLRFCICCCVVFLPFVAAASTGSLCDSAARKAAQDYDVPLDLMLAITRVETGRNQGGVTSPWPWAVNYGGQGAFYPSAADAEVQVAQAMAEGRSNIDIGCFQINLHWHGAAFTSIAQMFEPDENADYAARFLQELKARHGSWEAAAGAYHSNRPEAAEGYLSKVSAQMARGFGQALQMASVQVVERVNLYPLLRPGEGQTLGSLVATMSGDGPRPLF